MSDSVNVKKQTARNAWNQVFINIGGLEHLEEWAIEHPTEFYKIFAKLAPPIKEDKDHNQTHDSFIKMLMVEESRKLKQENKPIKLIDVTPSTIVKSD
jgi:hypothetical protein